MRRTVLFLNLAFILTTPALAEATCFLAKEKDKVIVAEGDCAARHSPCSTFKIALSLIGYDSGVLVTEIQPQWPFKKGYVDYRESWKQPTNPKAWMTNSCVWYSQVLTQKLGMKKFKEYVVKLNYGNQDVSGDKSKNNGLTNSWLSSSLEISPEEQAAFLQALLDGKLPVSAQSHNMTKNILYVEDLPSGWKLYGKTGSGSQLSKDNREKLDLDHGWFVGWIQKKDRSIVFVQHISDEVKQTSFAGPRAKEAAKEKLVKLIQDLK